MAKNQKSAFKILEEQIQRFCHYMAENQKSAFKILGGIIIVIALLIPVIIKETGHDISNRSTEQSKASLYEDCQDACRKGDFARAHEILSEIHTQIYSYGYEQYYKVFDYVYKAEIQFIMSEFSEDVCVDKITFLLNEIPIEGIKMPKGLLKNEHGDSRRYLYWTVHFNRLCDQILTLAINRKYKDVARNVLMQYVDNYEMTDGKADINGVHVSYGDAYINYTSADRDAAKKKYEEAVALGLFE